MPALKDKRVVSIIKLSKQAYGKYKLQILALAFLGFIGGLLEGIGVNALIPLFSFILGKGQGGEDFISQAIERFFLLLNINFSVYYLLIFITVLFILKALTSIWLNYIRIKITSDYEERTRNDLFNKTLAAAWPHLIKQKLGFLETVLMIDVKESANLLNHISNILMTITSLLIYLLVAINISVEITLITLIIGAIIFLVFKPLLYRIKQLAQARTRVNKDTAHHVNENILGLKTVKTMGCISEVLGKGRIYFAALKRISIKGALLKSFSTALIQPIGVIFIIIIFAFSYQSVGFNLAVLVAIVYLIQRIFIYLQQSQKGLSNISDSFPHLRSVLDYERQVQANTEIKTGTAAFKFNQALEFKQVDFSYDSQKKILTKLDLTINKGELAGLIGVSGVGKTTVVDLILRLLTPSRGMILIDGQDISDIKMDQWRAKIGYVAQDMFLINDTVANNIKFYDSSLTEKEIIKVAKQANIYNFIQSLPEKFETQVGERGVLVSVGQRQRIIIARVLARNPEFLILDEATSALDNESEIQIQKMIKKLKGKVTVLIIAHRLTTVKEVDKLIALKEGQIVEQGDPQSLLKDKDSYFYKVYNIRK